MPGGAATAAMPGSSQRERLSVPRNTSTRRSHFELLEALDQHHVHRAQLSEQVGRLAGRRSAAMRAQPVSEATMTSEAPAVRWRWLSLPGTSSSM